ncbi:hypothetical protein FHS89_000651 [Rubricella aquisinus]|jgi:hypothetical protein|uniref:Adenylosuccinate lyase n=1 Tax=Rubricella aquisinus TaxID=2028108 RepID=A0A840WYA0_9RHOB|nr:adenylosuccinate lyase [Rubricella aquisinus]MBB5514645.1 hypothetical protein [Rubricella aquisinus]
MRLKLIVAALALSLAPGMALAMGCSSDTANMSCPAGSHYDAATGGCKAQATS